MRELSNVKNVRQNNGREGNAIVLEREREREEMEEREGVSE